MKAGTVAIDVIPRVRMGARNFALLTFAFVLLSAWALVGFAAVTKNPDPAPIIPVVTQTSAPEQTPPPSCHVYEDGSARCDEGTYPFDCNTQGNQVCGEPR